MQLLDQWDTIYLPLLIFNYNQRNRKTIFIDLTVVPPEGYYAQLMSKSGLTVLYELEVKAGVIDPDFTGNVGGSSEK